MPVHAYHVPRFPFPEWALRAIFEALSSPCLILESSPNFIIVGANAAYLKATMTQLDNIVGKPIFEIFPGHPDNPSINGVESVRQSFTQVVTSRVTDIMPVLRYDIRRPGEESGQFEERYWSTKNIPVLDANGKVVYLLHMADDVTDFIDLKRHLNGPGQAQGNLKERIQILEAEMFQRAKERQEVNVRLSEANAALVRVDEARRRVERDLLQREQQYQLALHIGRIGTFEIDWVTNRMKGSAELAALCGMPAVPFEADIETLIRRRVHPDDRLAFQTQVALARSLGKAEHEWRTVWPDGTVRWLAGRVAVCEAGLAGPQRVLGVDIDITERKEAEASIRRAAQHDPLTNLPNRTLFHELAEHLLAVQQRANRPAALLFIDLDHFKPVNDRYGHAAGDAVLVGVAQRLVKCLRSEDVVGRIGGDEFVAALGNIHDKENAGRIVAHIVEALGQPHMIHGMELRVPPSIGISLFPRDGRHVNALIQCADTAMYVVKNAGANAYQFYEPILIDSTQEATRIERRLGKALEFHEFELVWLPVVDLETGATVGAEALLRWPGMGIPPQRFIPVAETMGIMPALCQWVLNEACRVRHAWREHGLPDFPVSVNITANQFKQPDFPHRLTSAMAEGDLHAGDLRLDITESALSERFEDNVVSLQAIRNLGVRVGLEAFGSGMTHLKSMVRLPFDAIKLDPSFAHQSGQDIPGAALIDKVLAETQGNGIAVVAECIETQASLDYLTAIHCPQGQGFLFTHPLSSNDFEDWYKRRAA